MVDGRPIKRGQLRLTREAVDLWIAGASVAEVAKRLKVQKQRARKTLAPITRREAPDD